MVEAQGRISPWKTEDVCGAKGSGCTLAERLERGDVIHYPVCPFPLPEGSDRQFLLDQQLGSRAHKNISYDPVQGKASGFRNQFPHQSARVRDLLAAFSRSTTLWLAGVLPEYAARWQLDRVSFRPEEEATRRLRLTARNDLLHVDAFPSRPTNGYRILRVFANVNPTEARVWVTSDRFSKLLAQYGKACGLPADPGTGWVKNLGRQVVRLFQPSRRTRSAYDAFMLRFHNYLKSCEEFQEQGPKHFWNFQPGSAWLVMTDTASHAVLRGRYALEHSYFIAPESLALPPESPPFLLEQACGRPVLCRAA
jgi:hypothetical protein